MKIKKLQYKDLDLKGLREKCGLDFAHFTYKRGMCSCCHGPSDLPAKYWKDGIFISWDLREDQMDKVLEELDRQVGSEFEVRRPLNDLACIALVRKDTAEEFIKSANLERNTVPFKNTSPSTSPSVNFLNPSTAAYTTQRP